MDDRLRRLERAWKETGSAADERAYRLYQLRAGELDEARLAAMAVRQVLIQPTGDLGKGPDPRVALDELVADDPLLQLRASHIELPSPWRADRRVPWQRTLAAPSDALLEEALARLRERLAREVEVSPPAPVFHQTFTGELEHHLNDFMDLLRVQVLLRFRRRPDLTRGFEVVPGEHPPEHVDAVSGGVEAALRRVEPVWLPFAPFEVAFQADGVSNRWDLFAAVQEAVELAVGRPETHQVLEPWVRVSVSGADAAQAIHALAAEGGWAEGNAQGVIALRRLPRARKRIEQAGCGVTWVYDRHQPAREDLGRIRSGLAEAGWNLGDR